MKYYISILILFVISSCCGTNGIAKTQSKESDGITQIATPETPEVIEPTKKVGSIEIINPETTEGYIDEELIVVKPIEVFNHSAFNDLLQKHVSKQGNVNYNGFNADRTALRNYITSLGDNIPDDTWTKEDKLAYWINAYNAMTIDLILRNPTVKSIKDIDKPWDQRLWQLGNKWYNLNQIEHDILRKMSEPRIHFAIVCASVSCPKLQNTAFTSQSLDMQLTNATKEFLSDSSKNNLSKNSIKLSKIFKWFGKDFKQNQSLIDFLNKYSDFEISQNTSKSYMDYNWNLND